MILKTTLTKHRKKFDTIWQAAQDLITTAPTYSNWLKGGRPRMQFHRELIENKGIKKWWK